MSRYYSTKELVEELNQRQASLRGITQLMRGCDRFIRNQRRAGTSESDIETAIVTDFEEVKDLLTDLVIDINTTIANLWDTAETPDAKYATQVEVGRPALFNQARVLPYSSKTSGTFSAIAPTGASVFNVFDTDDIVEVSGLTAKSTGKVIAAQDIVLNGGFSSGTYWTANSGWAIAGGVAAATAASSTFLQSFDSNEFIPLSQYGNRFTLQFTISGYGAGDVTPSLCGNNGTLRSADGTFSETITITNSGIPSLIFTGNGFTGNIDNVSLTPQDWLFVQPPVAGTVDVADLDNRALKVVLRER